MATRVKGKFSVRSGPVVRN